MKSGRYEMHTKSQSENSTETSFKTMDNIKMVPKETGHENVEWIQPARGELSTLRVA